MDATAIGPGDMLLGVLTVTAAVLWALARGRGLQPGIPRVEWLPVLVVGLVGQAVLTGAWLAPSPAAALGVVSHTALLAVGIVNFRLPGMAALTAGAVSNGLVMVANNGMPVSGRAVAVLGGDPGVLPVTGPHHLLSPGTRLPWLGDVVGVPWLDVVVSPGDALLVVGAIGLLGAALAGDVD